MEGMGIRGVGCGAWLSSLCSDVLFQPCLESHTPTRVCGGACPPTIAAGASRVVNSWCLSPPWREFGGSALKRIFYEKCLVIYCNFIVNLDHSLCRRSKGRSYVNLSFFCPRRQPSIIMRELYYDCVLFWETRLWESEEGVTTDLW